MASTTIAKILERSISSAFSRHSFLLFSLDNLQASPCLISSLEPQPPTPMRCRRREHSRRLGYPSSPNSPASLLTFPPAQTAPTPTTAAPARNPPKNLFFSQFPWLSVVTPTRPSNTRCTP